MKKKEDSKEIVLYTVEDIEDIFKMGRTKAYELMASQGFPSFRLNNRLYVEKEKLSRWIENRTGKTHNF